MEKMCVGEICSFNWEAQLEAFLGLFQVQNVAGVIRNQEEQQVGYCRVLSAINDEKRYSAQTEIILPYGGIRIHQDLNSHSLVFQINRDGSYRLTGSMRGAFVFGQFFVEQFSVTTMKEREEMQELSLLSRNREFYYRDYIQDEIIQFKANEKGAASFNGTLFYHYYKKEKERIENEIVAERENCFINEITVSNYTKKEFSNLGDLCETANQQADFLSRFQYALGEVEPDFYHHLGEVIHSYSYNDDNMITSAISQYLLPRMQQEPFQALFGQKLVKELKK